MWKVSMWKVNVTAAAIAAIFLAGVQAQADELPGPRPRKDSYKYSRDARPNPAEPKANVLREAKPGPKSAGNCAANIRAVGKSNIISRFARNSAIYAWQREAKHVHGDGYGKWSVAREPSVKCDSVNRAMQRCVATGRPCQS